MPTTLVRVLGFNGPNIAGPQPGVLLDLHADRDRSARLRTVLKDGAQRVGIVLGYVQVSATPRTDGLTISASFVTPAPAIGVALARYAAAALQAHEARDETWDADEQLWELQRLRRTTALPLPAVQRMAEAGRRGVPAFVRADGRVQLGYGMRGRSFDPAEAETVHVPWEQLGTVPIIALSGGAVADHAAHTLAQRLNSPALVAASFDQARALLADPMLERAIISLDADDLLRRGLPFEHCTLSAALHLPPPVPDATTEEQAQAVGLPLLVTADTGAAVLNTGMPALADLAPYAACPVVPLSGNPAEQLFELWRRFKHG